MRRSPIRAGRLLKATSLSLVISVILASPGPLAVRAFAGGVVGKAATAANPSVLAGSMGLPALLAPGSLSGSTRLSAPALGSGALPTLQTNDLPTPSAASPVSPTRTPVPAPAAEKTPAPALRSAAIAGKPSAAPKARSPQAARESLSAGVDVIQAAKSPAGRRAALTRLFTGSLKTAAGDEAAAPKGSVLGKLRAASTVGLIPSRAAVNAADAGSAVPKPEQEAGDDDFTPAQKKGILGMFLARPFGMLGFSLSAMAYPLMLIDAVGKSQMYDLFSIGGVISIGMNLVVGKLGDHMPLKKYIVYNNLLRAGLSLANAVLYSMGFLNFWSLLLLTVVNSFQFSSLFITDQAMTAEIVGANRGRIRSTEALIRTASILVNIGSGLFLGSIIVDTLGFVWTFGIVAAVTAIPALILWKMLPEIGYKSGKTPVGELLRGLPAAIAAAPGKVFNALRGLFRKTVGAGSDEGAAVRGVLFNSVLLSAAVAGYLWVYQTPFWIIGAMGFILVKSEIFRGVIMKHNLLKMALLLVMASAFVEVPMRNAVLGALSQEVAGEVGQAAFYGKLIASFYMGQLVTGTGLLSNSLDVEIKKIGPWKLARPFAFNLKKTMRWVGALVLAGWATAYILPVGWLATAAAAIPALGVKTGLAVPLVGMFAGAMTALWGYAREDEGKVLGTTLKTLGIFTVLAGLALPLLPGLLASMPAWGAAALGSALAGAALIKFYHAVHDYTPKVSERGWMRLESIGLLAVGIPPLIFWGNFPVLFASLFLFGMLHNPTTRTISATYSQQAKQHADGNYQYLSGIKGSFFTMATSTAYALYGLAKFLPEKLWGEPNAFPFTWYVVAGLYAVIAAVFLFGSKIIPFGEKISEKSAKE